ncbi:MAG: ImmA/IrrE family metallo-endopeptidase [Alphaproteobacteria bacterium]|nr:ImmA/IrrE family metallo-endopeptidase [Alphaproteobacteria bacterium]
MPRLNPNIMIWARETAGFTPEEAVVKLGIREARGVEPTERLAKLESGETEPTRPMIVKMAKSYRRPLVTFYMSHPPSDGDRGEDFRTLPADYGAETDAILGALLRDFRARQSMVRAVMEEEDEADALPFVGSMEVADGYIQVAEEVRRVLDLDLNTYRRYGSIEEAFSYLRAKAEDAGIFVILAGNLGSHHTAIDVETFRGFAVADDVAPFVVINDQDAKTAWSFTLLHELTHIWLGQTGVSGAIAEKNIEKFCNDVAGELLLPVAELEGLAEVNRRSFAEAVEAIGGFAGNRNISRAMVAYKLFRNEFIDFEDWQRLSQFFSRQWFENRAAARERSRDTDGGPNYYVVRRHRVGASLINLVRRMTANGALTTSKAGKVLGVKPKNVEPMIRRQVANNASGA